MQPGRCCQLRLRGVPSRIWGAHRGPAWDWARPQALKMLARAARRGEVLAFILAGALPLEAEAVLLLLSWGPTRPNVEL